MQTAEGKKVSRVKSSVIFRAFSGPWRLSFLVLEINTVCAGGMLVTRLVLEDLEQGREESVGNSCSRTEETALSNVNVNVNGTVIDSAALCLSVLFRVKEGGSCDRVQSPEAVAPPAPLREKHGETAEIALSANLFLETFSPPLHDIHFTNQITTRARLATSLLSRYRKCSSQLVGKRADSGCSGVWWTLVVWVNRLLLCCAILIFDLDSLRVSAMPAALWEIRIEMDWDWDWAGVEGGMTLN